MKGKTHFYRHERHARHELKNHFLEKEEPKVFEELGQMDFKIKNFFLSVASVAVQSCFAWGV